jgi:hypothetical protein
VGVVWLLRELLLNSVEQPAAIEPAQRREIILHPFDVLDREHGWPIFSARMKRAVSALDPDGQRMTSSVSSRPNLARPTHSDG